MKKTKYQPLIISLVLCIIVCVTIITSKDFRNLNVLETKTIYSDAFFIPGILCLCISILLKVAQSGFFDGISYCFKTALHYIVPFMYKKKNLRYYEYVLSLKEKRKSVSFYPTLVGLLFILIGMLIVWI